MIARTTLVRVRTGMAAPPEGLRSVIMLVCVEGSNHQQAAVELNMPVGTLMIRLYQGRLELAEPEHRH